MWSSILYHKGKVLCIKQSSHFPGKIAVSDPGEADIKVFSKSGKYLIRSEKGLHLNYPHGMDYHPWTKETVIADRGFSCVYVHDPKGCVQQMLTEQEDEKYCLGSPHYVCFDYMGNIYVTDNEDNSLVAYDTERRHLFTYGHPRADGMCDNELNNPAAVVVDRFGNILLADTGNCRVHLLDRNGKFKDYILTWEDGIGEPIAMTLTDEGNLIISEGNTGVIKIYSYMHLPCVIDTRVRTPEDGGDNYDIISIESGSTLLSESDEEDEMEERPGHKKSRSVMSNNTVKREASNKEFTEQLLALSASDPKRTQNMPKHTLKEGVQSGMSQWNHIKRGSGTDRDNLNTGSPAIKGILKNSGKPRFDFFTPKKTVEKISKPTSAKSSQSKIGVDTPEVSGPDRTVQNDTTTVYSRRSGTLPRSASSPKLQHSAGLHTREGAMAISRYNDHNLTLPKDRISSADSRMSLESLQNAEKPIVIIDQFKSGASIPKLNLLGQGSKKSRKMANKSSISQSMQSHESYQNSGTLEKFPDEMSSKKSMISIDNLSSIGRPREEGEEDIVDEAALQHYTADIFDKKIQGYDVQDDNM